MNYHLQPFYSALEELSVSLNDHQIAQFLQYYELLIEWNQKFNLTAITDFKEVTIKHFIDSLSLVRLFPDLNGRYLIDLGSGAGFPGIPLKIAFPELSVVLADSLNKRVVFLNEVIDQLSLTPGCAVHGRAEDLAHRADFREKFDICVSRAVAPLIVLSEYCLPFVRVGGAFVAYKGKEVQEELLDASRAISLLGGQLQTVDTFFLPGSGADRTLISVAKTRGTPAAYPRKAGTPRKCPLS